MTDIKCWARNCRGNLLAIILFVAMGVCRPAFAQQLANDDILPVNFISLGDVALVEEIPDSFYPNRSNTRDGRWRTDRWSCLLRRKMHPTLMDDVIKSYEQNGLTNPPDGFGFDDSKYVKTFFSDCFSWKMDKPFESGKLTEFERIRALRKFYERHRAEIEKYDVKLPMRIASIQEIQLKNYDRAEERFEIVKQPGSKFVKGARYPLRYRSDEPREFLRYLPMSADKAEAFLAKLQSRKLHLMESHLLVKLEAHPEVTSGVVGVLSHQELSLFIPGEYDTAVYVQKTKPLNDVARVQTQAPNSTSDPANSNDPVAAKMRAICRDLQLFNIDGLPISGSLPNGVLSPAQKKAFDSGQERLADRLMLGLSPQLLSDEVEQRGSRVSRDFQLLGRTLGEATLNRYYDERTRLWAGEDTFAHRESLQRFLREQGPTIRALAIKPPLRFRTLQMVVVKDYDFENERFPIDWPTEGRREGMELNFGLRFSQSRSFRHAVGLNITSPIAFPTYWNVGPDQGRKLNQLLPVVNDDVRLVFSSTVFDVEGSPNVTPVFAGPQGRREKIDGVLITPVSTALYADGLCQKKVWDTPLIVPQRPVLATGKPRIRQEEFYLWQPEIQVALLDRENPSDVNRADLIVAATSVFQEDAEYYRFGALLPHRIRGVDRTNLRSKREESKRSDGWIEFWDSQYQPFFPNTFFGSELYEYHADAATRVRDSQLEALREWLRRRLKAGSGEFRMDAAIKVDRDNGLAKLIPGDSNTRSAAVASFLPNSEELGLISSLTMPKDSRRRRFDVDDQATDFSVVFPAMQNRLLFAVDLDVLPEASEQNDVERYEGDLIVKVEKLETLTDARIGPQALIHIRPIRFEVLGSTDRNIDFETRLSQAGQTAFKLPVEIPKFTEADWKRQVAEQKREAAEAKEQKRREEIEREQERQMERERLEEEERERSRRKEEDREKSRQEALLQAERDADAERQQFEAAQAAEEQRTRDVEQEASQLLREEQRLSDAESDEINARCNQLIADGYAFEDIDWATGELLSGAEHPASGSLRKWFWRMMLLGGFAVVFWRFRIGLLESDIARLRQALSRTNGES
ncbi:hypothetical protein [Rosistilla oblonga]|uniref:hypothetical protein n=1 Tax=Rosistilla oblonga TaxID=2527990 RepID=UPI003A97AC46